jgi:hypothetical protein
VGFGVKKLKKNKKQPQNDLCLRHKAVAKI